MGCRVSRRAASLVLAVVALAWSVASCSSGSGNALKMSSAQEQRLAPTVCKLLAENTYASETQLSDYLIAQLHLSKTFVSPDTSNRDPDPYWIKIAQDNCPQNVSTNAPSGPGGPPADTNSADYVTETPSPATSLDPNLQQMVTEYGQNICQQLEAGRTVQDMVNTMVATGQVDQYQAAVLLGLITNQDCPGAGVH